MLPRRKTGMIAWIICSSSMAASLLLRALFDPIMGDRLPYITLFGGVALAAWFVRPWLASAFAVAGYFAADYFFIGPRYTIGLDRTVDYVGLGLYALSSLLIISIIESRRREFERIEEMRVALEAKHRRLGAEIADREASERQAQAEAQRFELMANSAPVLVWMCATDRRRTWCNRPYLDFVGRRLHQELGEGWVESIHPEDAEASTSAFRDAFDRRDRFTVEHRIRRQDGEYRWMVDTGVPLFDGEGSFTGYIGSCIDITDHKEAEERARQSEKRISEIVESLDDSFAVLDSEFRYVDLNRRAEQELGRPKIELIGKTVWDCFPQLHDSLEGAWLRRAMRSKRPQVRETVHPISGRFYQAKAYPFGGQLTLFVTDITEQRQIQKTAAELEQRFKSFMDNSPTLSWIKDEQGLYVFVNCALEDLNGWTAQDWRGKTDFEIYPKELAAAYRFNDEVVLADRKVHRFDEYVYRQDEKRSLLSVKFPFESATGETFVGGQALDVTEIVRAEAALRTSEARFHSFMEFTPAPTWIKDPEGRYVFVNRAMRRAFSKAPGELEGHTDAALFPKEIAERQRELDKAALDKGDVVESIEALPIDGETRHFLVVRFPMRVGEGQWHAAGKAIDVTDRVRAEREQQHLQDKLLEADHRKDEFLATLAHELRNPLAPIRNAVQLLRSDVQPEEMRKRTMEIIDRQVEHMVRLIDDLLEASRISRGKLELRLENIELAPVVENAIVSTRPFFENLGHKLIVELPEEPIGLRADPVRLAQILSNLLNNAAKYTPAGGDILLSAEKIGSQVMLHVKDTGVGIDPEHLPHIFDMFWQVESAIDRNEGGLGIGLSLVKSLVEMHGGTVEARSEGKGRGSEVIVRLPLSLTQAGAAAAGRNEAALEQGPGLHILVVDDNEDSASTLAMLLQLMGHAPETANSGPEALQLAKDHHPDLVLLDIGLPGMNGFEVAKQIRASGWGKAMRLIALSGWGQDSVKERAGEAGFDAHLTKPVDFSTLERVLLEHSVRQ